MARKVTVSERQVCLGDLLARLAQDAGVTIRASDRISPISGYLVSAYAESRPAGEVMDAVRALFDTRSDPWFWLKESVDGRTTYTLECTRSIESVGKEHDRFVERFLLELFHGVRQMLAAPPEEKALLLAAKPALKRYDTPHISAIFPAIATLTDDDLRAVLHGTPKTIPTPSFSPEQAAELRSGNAGGFRASSGVQGSSAVFRSELLGVPTILVRLGGFGTFPVLGGAPLGRADREAGAADWLGDGDKTDAVPDPEIEPAKLAPSAEALPPDATAPLRHNFGESNDEVADVLRRLSRAANAPILFDFPPFYHNRLVFRMGGRLHTVLTDLERAVVWKRHESTYLFRINAWRGIDRSATVPSTLRVALRSEQARNDGYLPLDSCVRLANLREEQ